MLMQNFGGPVRCIMGDMQVAYCWSARDVTAAMLVVKNKSISLIWELNSIFIKGLFTWRWGPQVGEVTRLGGVTRQSI